MSFKTRLEKIQEDEKLAGIMPDILVAHWDTKTPEAMADEILNEARDAIIKSGIFYVSPEVRAAEDDIDQTYKAILNGAGTIVPLREACVRWKLAASSKPGS